MNIVILIFLIILSIALLVAKRTLFSSMVGTGCFYLFSSLLLLKAQKTGVEFEEYTIFPLLIVFVGIIHIVIYSFVLNRLEKVGLKEKNDVGIN